MSPLVNILQNGNYLMPNTVQQESILTVICTLETENNYNMFLSPALIMCTLLLNHPVEISKAKAILRPL